MAATNIPVMITSATQTDSKTFKQSGWAYVWINNANASASGGGNAIGHSSPNIYFFVVLDRSDPTKVVFEAKAPDSTTVPPGLDAYLTPAYILLVMAASWVSATPQGALFDMITANGGGPVLRKLELYGSKFACGINSNQQYQMVSVPGTGLPGIESDEGYSLLFDLIPVAGGMYTPVAV